MRIVTIPPNPQIVEEMKRRREVAVQIPMHSRPSHNGLVPTIHLFDDYRATGRRLPVQRIIVGPGGDRDARLAAVK